MMYERIIEIMVILLAELNSNEELSELDFEKLSSLGYSNEEITTAFSWLVDKLDTIKGREKTEKESKESSFRILNKLEKELFTTEAWGEIINLKTLGFLTNENIESLIDWAIFVEIDKIDKVHLYNYLAYNIFNLHGQQSNGSRYMLSGNDKIN